MEIKKIVISAIALPLTMSFSLPAAAQQQAGRYGKAYEQVEGAFRSATDLSCSSLKDDPQFMASLKSLIAKGDQASAQIVADHSTFVFMNGLLNTVGEAITKMSQETRASEAGKKTVDLYNSLHIIDVGSQVPDFTLPAPDGKTINFYSFIKDKKCVLLDFWASWCVWCRKENPNVRAVYDSYKDKGFDVLSVSLDEKEAAWRKALDDDKPTWPQAVDYRGTKDGLYKWYNLNGIPAIFLIDNTGHIIAKGLRGSKIEEAVKDYLKL